MKSLVALLLVMTLIEWRTVKAWEVTIGLILPYGVEYPFNMMITRPAIDIALEEAKKTILPTTDFKIIARNSKFSSKFAPLAVIDIHGRIDVLFGPVYSYAVSPIASYAPYWNLPMLTAGAEEITFRDKIEYGVTRVGIVIEHSAQLLTQLALRYNWRVFGAIFYNIKESPKCYHVMWAMDEFFLSKIGVKEFAYTAKFNETSTSELDKLHALSLIHI